MKKLLLLTFLMLAVGLIAANGQCVPAPNDPCVPVNQSDINKASEIADKLRAANDVISKFVSERTATDAERKTAQYAMEMANALLDTRAKMSAEYERIGELYRQVVTMQGELIDRLTKQLNAPKSAWQKFVSALKTVTAIAFGVGIGRGL